MSMEVGSGMYSPCAALSGTGAGRGADAAAAGKAKVDRLVMGLITPYLDYMRPWINGTADHNIQHDPAFEWLVEIDPETGEYKPWLAESWEMARTADHGASNCKKACNSTTAMASSPPRTSCTTMPCGVTINIPAAKILHPLPTDQASVRSSSIEVVNDHEVVMHCKNVCLDMPFYYSSAANVMMFSKAQWDKEGEMGYEKQVRPVPDRMSSRSGSSAATCCTNAPPRRTGSTARWTGKSSR